ncbi:FAD-dependent oxidoreductase [Candidatus Formimonas warabiya]|uniref:Rhodanese domain-containing protein n=1 Tax=Formimonas warabiya TaxID=1761012 RepID=A0A3G1L247_FORW1|nr:FAD-dependent oxidoreductase [Candidatus Formimonas warabiya]ATW28856.1 hypothetical protein DCMF_23765 [Candidatus Formimonas warabiya]
MTSSKRIVIIGGVAAGPKTAARARRLLPEADITVIEQGEHISYGSCGFPLYLAGMIPDLTSLSVTAAGLKRDVTYFAQEKDVRFLVKTCATFIDREHQEVVVWDREQKKESRLPYDDLVLATGSQPVIPDIPGIELKGIISLHHPEDAQLIRSAVQDGVKKIAVIGGGLIGMEAAAALSRPGREVTVFEKEEQILPGILDPEFAGLVRAHLEENGIQVFTGETLKGIKGDGKGGNVRRITTNKSIYDVELVVLACGVRPNIQLASACGLTIGATGAIQVNAYLQTNDPHIYAGGDCVENVHLVSGRKVYFPLASTANKHGRVIGSNLAGLQEKYPGVLGTVALQAGDYNIGKTGLTEAEAKKLGYPVRCALVSGHDTAHYHPLHGKGMLKLVVHEETEKLLGAQVVGIGEVIKRLDVLATALHLGADAHQIAHLDLGYAPPFATPIDLCLHGVHTLQNLKQGLAQAIPSRELARMGQEKEGDFLLLDVRTSEEARRRPVKDPRSVNIPLSDLRTRFSELFPQKEKKIVTVCPLGVRAYEAACLLKGKGFTDVAFLEGGISALPGLI